MCEHRCSDAAEGCEETCKPARVPCMHGMREPCDCPPPEVPVGKLDEHGNKDFEATVSIPKDALDHLGGVPLWDEAQFAFLNGIQARVEVQALSRTEATALVLSWMITGLAKNVAELELMAGACEDGDTKANALLIAEICGSTAAMMKNDIDAAMQTRNRVQLAKSLPKLVRKPS